MHEPFDFVDYAYRVRQVFRALMSSVRSPVEIAGRMHLLNLAAERDLRKYGRAPEVSRVACGPGCGACCVLNVSVLIPEAVTISRFLQKRLSDAECAELCERLRELKVKTRWVDDEERIFMRESCAFLDPQGSCVIHAVRPLMCRAITSTDPAACRDGIAMAPLQGAPVIEMDIFHKQMIETVYSGLANALEELGLDHRPQRLSSAALALLTRPGIAEEFISGGKVSIS